MTKKRVQNQSVPVFHCADTVKDHSSNHVSLASVDRRSLHAYIEVFNISKVPHRPVYTYVGFYTTHSFYTCGTQAGSTRSAYRMRFNFRGVYILQILSFSDFRV